MRRLPIALSFVLFWMLVAGCASSGGARSDAGVIKGVVEDAETGERLPGVALRLTDRRLGARTDDRGRFRIAGVPPGTYDLRAEFVGYRAVRQRIRVEAGTTHKIDFELRSDLGDEVLSPSGER
jgi:hypothetical protein